MPLPALRPAYRTALLALAVACAGLGCSRTSARPSATLALKACRLPGVSAAMRCGTLRVPEDRAERGGRTIELHLAVLPALSGAPRPDPLFVLAGGPGQAASDVAALLVPAFERVRRTRDLVFVDQRGTGRSHKLDCGLEAPDAGLAESLRAELVPEQVDACLRALDARPAHYTTPVAMQDLDEVRAALGYERVNLWGASYGTRAALVYARMFPARVRTLILDGVAPMSLLLPLDAAADADRALRRLFASCAGSPGCRARWPTLEADFEALRVRLAQSPARVELPDPVTGAPVTLEIDRDAFGRTLRALLYEPEAATLVPLTIARARDGDFRPFAAQAELLRSGFGEGVAVGMFLSVVCTEDVPYLPEGELERRAKDTFLGEKFGEAIVKACARWPKGSLPEGYREAVRSEAPALLFSGELDPVTPPRWAKDALKTLPNGRHVVLPASGHGTFAHACARRMIETFLEAAEVRALEDGCAAQAERPPFFLDFAGPGP